MEVGPFILTLVSLAALIVVGALALLRPYVLQDLAKMGTESTRTIPVVRRVWYDWARSRYYVGTVRLVGVFALLIAFVLTAMLLTRP